MYPSCQNIDSYKTNSYIDKMYCSNNTHYQCGKTMFGRNTINVHTPTIPPRIGFSYINSILPNEYPYVYYYGSYKNKLINYR